MEAERLMSSPPHQDPWESFIVKNGKRVYQATYHHTRAAWCVSLMTRRGSIDPHGRVGAKIVEACREVRRTG